MSIDSTRETMTRYFNDDVSTLADDVVFTMMATGEEWLGPTAVQAMLEHIYRVAFRAHVETRMLVCGDNNAVLEAEFVGTHTGEFAGIRATGKEVRVPLCVAYDLEGGRIRRARIYFEIPAFVRQASG